LRLVALKIALPDNKAMTSPPMVSLKDVATMAARRAGEFIRAASRDLSSLRVEQKSLHDYVSQVDRGAEQRIVSTIQSHFPEHAILGEEFGRQGPNNADFCWVIDPLDGTTNFLRGVPHFAVSIGVLHGASIECGVVFDPVKDELFCAVKGEGATLNDGKIQVSERASITGALLSTGVPFSGENLSRLDSFTNTMSGLLQCQTSGLRRLGAAALDLAYVAAGRYDGFWEASLNRWDIAAGILLVTESGGKVSSLDGGDDYLESGNILAATPAVHTDMLSVTQVNYALSPSR